MIDIRRCNKKQKVVRLLTAAFLFLSFLLSAVDTWAVEGELISAGNLLKAHLELKEQGPFYVGDFVPVNLIIEGVPGVEYLLPELEPKQLNGLELAAKDKVKKEEGKEKWKHIVSYRFIGWRAGQFKISGLTINFQEQSGNQGSIKVKDLQIKITSLLPANLSEEEILADGLKSTKKPVGLPPRYQYVWVLLGVFGLFGLVYWLLKYWKSNYRNKVVALEEQGLLSIEPAHLIALRRLDDLRRGQLLEKGEFKLFYDQLSEVAREYLENRFQIKALEMTTEEFLLSLGRMDFLGPAQKNILAEFLQYSDLVKFAKHQPVKEEGEKALTIVYGLIEETKEDVENDI